MYLTNLSLTGQWLGAVGRIELSTGTEDFDTDGSLGLRAGPAAAVAPGGRRSSSTMSVEEFRSALPRRMAKVLRYHPEEPEELNRHVTTLVVRLYLGPLILKVSWEHQKEKRGFSNSLMMVVYDLNEVEGEVGGLLGSDSIPSATSPPNCRRPVRRGRQFRKQMAVVVSGPEVGGEVAVPG